MRYLFTFLLVSISLPALSDIRSSSKPMKITVFLNGVEYIHETEVKLAEGPNDIIFGGLSDQLNAQSVQATLNESVEILSVSVRRERPGQQELHTYLNKTNKDIEQLQDDLDILKDEISSYEMQLEFLKENYNLTAGRAVTTEDLDKTSEYFRTKTFKIKRKIAELQADQEQKKKRLKSLELNRKQRLGTDLPYRRAVALLVNASKSGTYKLRIRYVAGHAGWAPTYDIVAQDIDQPITLKYKANVYNNTGVDWTGVPLILSTGDPKLSSSMPSLEKWDMKYNSSQEEQGNYQATYGSPSIAQDESIEYKTINVPSLATEFKVKDYDIPSNGRPYTVQISTRSLPAQYYYGTVPKLDPDAFLLAKVTGWTDLDLIDGPASVYFGGTYIGESEIDTRVQNDTLKLSLGRDAKMKVSRKLVTETDEKASIIGNSRKETYTYRIVVRNDRNIPAKIDVYDQIPIPVYDDINVTAKETSEAETDDQSGLLKWEYTLQPGESREITLSYSIKYPKHRKINARTFRTISCPSF